MRRQHGRRKQQGLGDLPYPLRREMQPGPTIKPETGLIPEWINYYKASNFPFVIGVVSQQIIPANPLRAYVLIQNKSVASDMFINFGNDATTFNGIVIIPRGNYEFIGGANGGPFSPSDSIHVLGAVAGMNGVIVEGVLPPVMPEF